MRITADFSALWVEVRRITQDTADFQFESIPLARDPIDIGLSEGLEVALEDVEFDRGGLASVRGRQVLLYIPDHGFRIATAIQQPRDRANRFHVAFCAKLEEMKARNRFERYTATNDLGGRFKIFGTDNSVAREERVELSVCKFCLQQLNYKGSTRYDARQRAALTFKIPEFFETYSSFFPFMPSVFRDTKPAGYTEDWEEISAAVRRAANHRCDDCGVDLTEVKRLLHVHHINGVKSDNRRVNLRPLCVDCHRRQPNHDHMHVAHRDTQIINRLRRRQGKRAAGWESALKLADPAVHGVLDLLQTRGRVAPEIGYEIQDESSAVIEEFEMAWPRERFAIVIDPGQRERIKGWHIQTVAEFLREHNS